MKKKEKGRLRNKRFLEVLIIMLLVFSVFKIGVSFASSDVFYILDAQLIKKSENTVVKDFKYENGLISGDVIFHSVGDSVTYKVKIKNDDNKAYTIKTVSDDNTNEFIKYVYSDLKNTKINSKEEFDFEITEKYAKEVLDVEKRLQNISVNINFLIEDEEGNKLEQKVEIGIAGSNNTSNPKTNDDITIYFITAIGSIIALYMLRNYKRISNKRSKKNRTINYLGMFIICAVVLPHASKAANESRLALTFNHTISLEDKLVVTVDVAGEKEQKIIKYGELLEIPEKVERDGYTFECWKKKDGTEFNPKTPIKADEEIVASYNTVKYKIEYELNAGQAENVKEYTVEDEIILNNPEKEGYTFSGWTGSNGEALQTKVTIFKGTTGDKKYIANYSPNPKTEYTVIHKVENLDNDEYVTKETEKLYGATDTVVKPQTKQYDEFDAPEEKEITIAGNGKSTLEYKYKRKMIKLTIEDEDYTESSLPSSEYKYGTKVTLKAKTKDGFTFEKWSNGNTNSEIEVELKEDLSIKPLYTINHYTVSYQPNNTAQDPGSVTILDNPTIEDADRTYKQKLGPLPEVSNGEKFLVGWYSDELFQNEVTAETEVVGDMTCYAKWRDPKTYTITLNTNGGTCSTAQITVTEGKKIGECIEKLPVPTKENYKFRGWFKDQSLSESVDLNTELTESTEYYAKWVDRMELVFNIPNEVDFNGPTENIIEGQVPSQYLGNDGKFINTGIELFTEKNKGKDFEIGFEIVSFNQSEQVNVDGSQYTLMSTKNENGSKSIRPGFVFRYDKDADKFEFVVSDTKSLKYNKPIPDITSFKVYREGGVIYYSFNNEGKNATKDFSSIATFSTPVTFGAALKTNESAIRHFKGTLKNMYIYLEVDDYEQ